MSPYATVVLWHRQQWSCWHLLHNNTSALFIFKPNANISKSIFCWFQNINFQNRMSLLFVSVAENCLKPAWESFLLQIKTEKLLYVQRVILAALVSFKSSCLTLALTKQLCENSSARTACLTMHGLICPRGIPRLCWSNHWCHKSELVCVPVSTWVHQRLLFRVRRSMRRANK